MKSNVTQMEENKPSTRQRKFRSCLPNLDVQINTLRVCASRVCYLDLSLWRSGCNSKNASSGLTMCVVFNPLFHLFVELLTWGFLGV